MGTSTYEDRLTLFLLNQRRIGDLIQLYRILHNTFSVDLPYLLFLNEDEGLWGFSLKLRR